jgi:translocation and assembly module TamA
VETLGGTIGGAGSIGWEGPPSPVEAFLEWRDLDLGRMPMEIPAAAAGLCSGELEIAGSLAQPTGAVDIRWRTGVDGSLPELRAVGGLEDGVVRIATDEIVIPRGSGTLTAEGELPIGLLARPDWLWPEAPDHDARISLQGRGLDSAELLELFGRPAHEVGITGDLELEAEWRPNRPEETRAFVEVRSARFRHRGGEIVADRPIVLKAAGTRVVLEPMILKGRVSRVEIEAGADLATGALEGTLDAVLAPGFGRNIPYPVQIHEPVSVAAELGGTTRRPRVALRMSHPGGALVFRDPPLRIRDLVLDAEVVDGTLWIKDGRARVNQGTMEIGGGWDPVNRQGVVAEFENVVVFVGGILSQWTGAVAVEPEPDRLAKVVGEVNLVAGLWDQNVRLGGALFGPQAIEPAADDPLNEISLDLDVRGRGIVRVENNLGRFDARWDVLRVTGVAARPRLNGEIRISPGGRFSLAGQRVRVRRGGLLFTGDPDVDPIVEIVPESDFAVFGDEEGQVSTTALATQGLVEGIAGAFGFENETLQPAEISVDLERESSQQLKLGQRLSHNVALFFATNTTDVQDRTSMLQFWNLPGLHGLAVQGYQQTLTDEYGANLIQRFQWGGSPTWEDRPTIRKLALEGGWPLGKRRLRRAVGFRKGQPFDPFLEFVAQVRLERELAEAGYQEARVTATSVEANNAWTMIFECDPGPQQTVDFEGDVPARRVREEVTALYRHPPLEGLGFRNMAMLIERHFGAEGYPDAVVLVERRDDRVVAEVARQGLTDLTGPVLAGVPEEVEASVVKRLGGPAELALLSADPARAAGVIQKTLIDLGFRDATVRSVETVPLGSERGEVRAEVDLGPQAVVAEVVVTGSDPLGVTGGDAFSLKVGSPLDRLSVDLAASRIRAQYDAAGYSDAVVRGAAEQTDDGSWIVTVDLEPGIRRVLTGIEVNGLKHTSRRSIVAGMTINEGEILRNSDLDTTAVRVANFAPIDRLDVRTVPEGADGAKVELDVVEKDRWTAEVGGGWSTERGIQARLGLRDDNLLGRGFGLNLRGRWDRVEWLGFLVASLPPLPGKKLAFTSTIGFSRGEPPDGDSDLISDETVWSIEATRWLGGGELAAGTAGEQVTAYYRFTRTHTYDKVPPDPDDWWIFPIDITTDIGLLGARYVRDRFDAPFDPTRGYGIFIDAGTSSELLGSDFEYWTALATGSTATGIFGSTTWVQSVRLGVAEPLHGQNLIEEVKFFAGGQGSIRGFDRNSVGPVTYGQNDWVPAGGGALAILNEELRIPIKGGFRAAVFADVGQIWESWGVADGNLAVGAGIGIRWATPIGPLWADVAWPVVNPYIEPPGEPPYPYPIRRMSSSKPKFYLGIGRPF